MTEPAHILREALRFPSGQSRISMEKAREIVAQLAFPWAGETPRRVMVTCDRADLIAAYARVQQ